MPLGDGSTRSSDEPIAVYGDIRFKSIASGAGHTCGLDNQGGLYCWGYNSDGSLGLRADVSYFVPTKVPSRLRYEWVSCGLDSTCVIAEDGKTYCWGANEYGQLGNHTTSASVSPVEVLTTVKFQSISVGRQHACGLASDGTAWCWGDNGYGQLGNATTVNASVPTPVVGGLRFASVLAGNHRTIAITTSGAMYTWGIEKEGEPDVEPQLAKEPRVSPVGSDWASVETILAYRQDGDYGEVEHVSEELLRKYPNTKRVVYEVARLMADLGKLDQARVGIQKLRDLGEDRIALLSVATVELRTRDFDAMEKDLARAEKLATNEAERDEVRVQRALAHSEMGRHEEAIAEYRKILAENPQAGWAMNNLAYELADANIQLQNAYDMAHLAVSADPENADRLDTLGFICNRMARFDEARVHLEHALANSGLRDPDILEHLGDTYSKLGDLPAAQAMWKKALESHETEPPLGKSSSIKRIREKLQTAQPQNARKTP